MSAAIGNANMHFLNGLIIFIRKVHLSYSLFGRLSQNVLFITDGLYLFAFIWMKDCYFFLQLTQADHSKYSLHS